MCILTRLGTYYPALQWVSRIGLIILFPLSLWIALIPIDQYVPSTAFSDKILHFLVFFGFSLLLHLAQHQTPHFWYTNGLPLIAYGFLIEILQSFSLYRSFSILDGIADAIGVIAFWLILRKFMRDKLQ
jgi:VanZ family protein